MKKIKLLVYHGSRDETKNKSFLEMVNRLQEKAQDPVLGCFLEFGSPLLENVMAQYPQDYEVTVIPLFFLKGKHYEEDLKDVAIQADSQVNLLPPLVEDDHFIRFIQQSYDIKEPFILAAHGSAHFEAKQALCAMAKRLAEKSGMPWLVVMLAEDGAQEKLVNFQEEYGSVTMLPLTFGKGKVYYELKSLASSNTNFHIMDPLSFNQSIERYILKKIMILEGS
ncbi:sirohydrochlorin chelatase [Oceanobacillus picturae]|uniref:sirohydrochlorin chelatase n=1 Tax=Oceanobacillus picturae TaxID=171693 RepID=UPI003632C690